jgi:hypothetical protein
MKILGGLFVGVVMFPWIIGVAGCSTQPTPPALSRIHALRAERPSLPQDTTTPPFVFADLRQLIIDNHITTIDALLPLLPHNLLVNYAFVYESRGLHKANAFFDQPRVVLFSRTFFLAYGKDPKLAPAVNDTDDLETMEFDPQAQRFTLRNLTFGNGQSPFTTEPEENPQVCQTCHGADPHPISDAYDFWPGFYGSVERDGCATMEKDTPEMAGYQAFLGKNRTQSDRYRFLQPEISSNDGGLGNVCPVNPDSEYTAKNAFTTRPTDSLAATVAFDNLERVKRIIQASPSWPQFQYLIAGIAGDCDGYFFPLNADTTPTNQVANLQSYFPPGSPHWEAMKSYDAVMASALAAERAQFAQRLARFNRNNAASISDIFRRPVDFVDPSDQLGGGRPFDGDMYEHDNATLILILQEMGIPYIGLAPRFEDGDYNLSDVLSPQELFVEHFNPGAGVTQTILDDATCAKLHQQSLAAFTNP